VPIITDVGAFPGTEVNWYLDGLSEFVQAALAIPTKRPLWRAKRLFAVPFIGAGAGGQSAHKGTMQQALLGRLELEASRRDIDLVLVLANDSAYTAAQAVRRNSVQWPFEAHERARLDELADHANHGRLVLFLGAGLSRSAGLPLWKELLEQLARIEGTTELKALGELSPLDAAAILDRRFRAKGHELKAETARLTTTPCFGLGHALLAALPVTERVTTNYDECIEHSLTAAGRKLSVLPYHPIQSEADWLLKLHGTISEPNNIVITREDYLRYESRRGALYGIVQAMMLTRHILFLGFSLKDENFNILVDEVRRALEGLSHREQGQSAKFGTAFVPKENTTAAELWDTELHVEQLGNYEAYPRELEVALDYLSFATTSTLNYLLDDSFAAILTEEQHRLKVVVRGIFDSLSERDIASPTFEPIVTLLDELGARLRKST